MRKVWTLLLCVVMVFSLAACGGDKKEEDNNATVYTYEIGFLTASSELSIDDGDRIEAAWNGVRQFAEEHGKTYKYYEPESADAKAQAARVGDAVDEGVKYIVAAGPEVKDGIALAQKEYKDVTFIYLDGQLDQVGDNCVTVTFNPLHAGFLAGYSAVLDGIDNIGYLADGKSDEAVSYGYGFLQGANEAAMRYRRYAIVHYNYGSADADAAEIKKTAKGWFDAGADAVFTYGGDVFEAVKTEAEKAERRVIASNASKEYSKTVITSARKCYEEAVAAQLGAAYDGTFKGGQSVSMSIKNDGVGLDMAKSKFQYFNKEQYQDICKELAKGDIKVLSAKDAKSVEDLVKAKWMYNIRIEEE